VQSPEVLPTLPRQQSRRARRPAEWDVAQSRFGRCTHGCRHADRVVCLARPARTAGGIAILRGVRRGIVVSSVLAIVAAVVVAVALSSSGESGGAPADARASSPLPPRAKADVLPTRNRRAQVVAPLDSGRLMSWGQPGPGKWVTIYANSGHVYLVVAGVRFDTSGTRSTGSRWQKSMRPGGGFVARHPPGL